MSKPTWEKEKSHRLPLVLLPGFIKDTEPLRTENSKATWRKCIKARIPELPGKDLECETHPRQDSSEVHISSLDHPPCSF